jgi:ABC-2 type transport system permease protein
VSLSLSRSESGFPRELLINLTQRELKGKFKRSTLGWVWSFVNPISSLLIYSLVFGVFLKVDPPTGDPSGMKIFPFFLVCGLLPWMFLANGLNGSTGSLVANANLIRKVYFPRWVLPTASVASWLATFLAELLVLLVALVIAGNFVHASTLGLPVDGTVLPFLPLLLVVVAIQSAFVLGLGLLLGAVNAYFRDVEHFLAIFLNLWFYGTPILYKPDLIPEHYRSLVLNGNPMASFVDAYRDLLYHLRVPPLTTWLEMLGWAAIAMAIGSVVFRRLEPRLAEEL